MNFLLSCSSYFLCASILEEKNEGGETEREPESRVSEADKKEPKWREGISF